MIRLYISERRRCPAIADDRPFAMFLAVAEPLEKHGH